MIIRNTLKAAALASVCLIPLAAMAQDDTGLGLSGPATAAPPMPGEDQPMDSYDNQVTLGINGQSSTSAEYGRYNGMFQQGGSIVGDLLMRKRPDWKSNDTYYYTIDAQNLKYGFGSTFDVMPNSTVNLKVGNQGTWGLTAEYWGNTYVAANNFQTLYNTNGSLVNDDKSNSGAALARMAQMDTVGMRRDRGTVGMSYIWNDWTFTASQVHEHKSGTQEQTAMDLVSNSTAFLQPINYDTDRSDAAMAYNTRKFQAKLGYTFMNFRDNGSFVNLANVTTGVIQPITGVYTLPPSNSAQNVSAQLGYNLTDTTRLNGNFVYGIQTQNDRSNLMDFDTHGNSSAYNGLVNTFFGDVHASSRPIDDLDVETSYTVDSRQSMSTFLPGTQVVATGYAAAPSWTQQTGALEVGYDILPSTKVTLGYTYRDEQRTESLVAHNTENAESLKVRTVFSPGLTGSLGYEHSVQTASDPDWWTVLNAIGKNGVYSATLLGLENSVAVPFYEAGRTRDAVTARMSAMIDDQAEVGLFGKVAADNYPSQMYGVIRDLDITTGPDVSYRISPKADVHTYYTYQRTYRSMLQQASTTNTAENYADATVTQTHSGGIGGTWKAQDDLSFGADCTVSYTNDANYQDGFGALGTTGGQNNTYAIPADTSMISALKLHGDYAYQPDLHLLFGYGFDRMTSYNWALWGAGYSNGMGVNLPTGTGNPTYSVNTVYAKVQFKW